MKLAIISKSLLLQMSFYSLSIFKCSGERVIFTPFFSFTFKLSIYELSIIAFFLHNQSSNTMRLIIFKESIVIEAISVKFSISLSTHVDYLSFIKRSIRHRRKFILCKRLSVLLSKGLYLLC